MIKKNLFIPFLLLVTASAAHAQRWQQKVDYAIDVTLTDSTHSLDGTVRIRYLNRSPDTLSYIWFRVWPNAFKNDRTAFSEQLIREGRTDFYFSDKSQKGYINRLEFRAGGQLARVEDHPQYIDVIKVFLPAPLQPGDSTILTTPFHVQLPDDFSYHGYHQGIYDVTNWYPSPAVYDAQGWHAEPYLDHGGDYSEFGDFDVRITIPVDFVIAASSAPVAAPSAPVAAPSATVAARPSAASTTLSYHENNVPGFAWFASRRFRVDHDTLGLPSGRIIDLYSVHRANAAKSWKYSLSFLKAAIGFYSAEVGEYPFTCATVVETLPDTKCPLYRLGSGASYPAMIAVDGRDSSYADLRLMIAKSVADIWFSVIVGTDVRRYPWMTEGIGSYYWNQCVPPPPVIVPDDTFHRALINTRAALREDQPASTSFGELTPENYRIIAGDGTAVRLLELRQSLGLTLFDSAMRRWFRQEAFQHDGPRDLKSAFVETTGRDPDVVLTLLDTTGPVPPNPDHQPLKPSLQLIPHPGTANALNISPALGFNDYDHLMVGLLIHNFDLPPDRWQILAAPLYSPVSHQINGLGHINRAWYQHGGSGRIEAGVNGARFSTISGADSNGRSIFGGFYKVVPYLRLRLPRPSPGSTWEGSIDWKTFLIGEKGFDNYVLKTRDSLYYPTVGKYDFRYLNQLSFSISDKRVLYPYGITLQLQQAAPFYRVNLDINYFFNYGTTGGLAFRLFGAKFGYLGTHDPSDDLTQFEPKLTAVRGSDDYTYENYFIGRNEFNGLASQQIMMRDGDLKIRTDLFQGLQGRSDNWVAAVNLSSTLPEAIVPGWLPLKLFLDLGTYAEAWSDNPPTSHLLYVGGFELCLLHNSFCVYVPLLYSSDFSNQLKTVPGQNGFFQKISFSIDFRNIPFIFDKTGYSPFR